MDNAPNLVIEAFLNFKILIASVLKFKYYKIIVGITYGNAPKLVTYQINFINY